MGGEVWKERGQWNLLGVNLLLNLFLKNLQVKVESHFVYKCCNVFSLNLFIQVLGASYIFSIQLTFIPRRLSLRQSIRYFLKALEEGIKGIFGKVGVYVQNMFVLKRS